MKYNEALDFIHNTNKFGIKLGLQNMKILLNYIGDPHLELKYIHIAGTNGKGSTAMFVSQILIQTGLNVGLYTSPYLIKFNERIRINNIEISDEELIEIVSIVKNAISKMVSEGYNHPTEFEIVTAIAFYYYNLKKCDVVVLEVGLGGRFDATNVILKPLLSVITSISIDHTKYLGDTIEKIAFEKAGIIKENGIVLSYDQYKEARNIIEKVCSEKNANITYCDFNEIIYGNISNIDYQTFSYKKLKDLKISMIGEYQIKNAVLAIEIVNKLKSIGYDISDENIKDGLFKAKWAGRFEVINKEPLFIIDGAHNLSGAIALKESIHKYCENKKIIMILGILKDKDVQSIIAQIVPLADMVYLVDGYNDREMSTNELYDITKMYCNNSVKCDKIEIAVNNAFMKAEKSGIIIATGSLYMIGHIKELVYDLKIGNNKE